MKRPTSKRRSGYRHPLETSSHKNFARRILSGKRRASRAYRYAKRQLTERELERETR